MLSKKDNELLCQVSPGTPMGNLMRLYWIPAFISSELEVDGWPRRIRLLGEDLIAGRDSNPHFEVVPTTYGHFFGARREADDDNYYWRINQYGMPWYTAVTGPFSKVWMPIDDYNTLIMEWSPSRPPGMPREYDDMANMDTARQPWGYKPDNMMIPWGNWRL